MKINPLLFILLAVALLGGTIFASEAAGIWSVSGKYEANGEKIQATGQNPDEIKGWMSTDSIISAYSVSRQELYAQFHIPDEFDSARPLKDIETVSENFSVVSLREWLETRMNESEAASH